jgi:MFS family permease
VLIPAVIASGIFIGINNTVTTQAVMTVSPVERPVASAAYSFVRFIGGGLAPYVAGRLVIALNIHVPFYIASGAILLGIVILATAHRPPPTACSPTPSGCRPSRSRPTQLPARAPRLPPPAGSPP